MELTEITLAHGGGGSMMHELLERELFAVLGAERLGECRDSAEVIIAGGRAAFTTDSFVVQPLEFPGGDIGTLAVCGTVNDLAASGAVPRALSLGLILEEGLSMALFRRVVRSIADTAAAAGVAIVTGDTKVVEKGGATGMYINTSGIGELAPGVTMSRERLEVGDVLLVNGPLGDHGMAVMSQREGLSLRSPVTSDVAALGGVAQAVLARCGDAVKCMTDLTRGGLAANCHEWAVTVGLLLDEQAIPVRPAVRGACDLLGIDPLTVANEGKMLWAVRADAAESALAVLRGHELGRDAAIIGKVIERAGQVRLKTVIGVERMVAMPYGEELPRIC